MGNNLASVSHFFYFFPMMTTMPEIFSKDGWLVRTRGTRLLIFLSLYSRRSFLLISLAFENPLSKTLSLYPRLFKWWRKFHSLCSVVSTMEHIRFTLMAWLNGILLKQFLWWQQLGERYWCLSVGLEYKSVVMLPSFTVVVVSRKDILVFDPPCVNFIDGWILLACSKKSSISLSLCIHFMSTSSINRNHERGCLVTRGVIVLLGSP